MSQITQPSPIPRRSVPLWAQILIWSGLLVLLGFLAVALIKAQQPMIETGAAVPEFTLTLFDGYEYNGAEQVNLSELRGKVVVINFWASWCVPCEEEAADLEAAWRLYQPGGEVVFLGVDYLDPLNGMSYLEKFNITYPNGPDTQESISGIFNRNMGVPETYFIDRQGVLRFIQIGPFQSVSDIQAQIEPLLVEQVP
jgi:cytochrome c biogenesis protein CcmG/thiol:disulfide interchange protein DsbE